MAETITFATEARPGRGTRHSRSLRKAGRLPAVLYGHKEATVPLTLDLVEFSKAIRHGVRVVDLQAEGKVQKALIRDLQWDHLGKDLLHVDFARIDVNERVVVTVPLEMRGTAAGIAQGGVLDQTMHTLSIECLAIAIPDRIRVNVAELQLGQALHVKEIVLPEGVKAMADPETVVVHVALKQVEMEAPAAAAPTAEAAEPELIGRKAAEEAEEEEGEQKPAKKG